MEDRGNEEMFVKEYKPLGIRGMNLFLSSPRDNFSLLLDIERGRGRNINAREKHQFVASCMCPDQGSYLPGLGIKPAT